MLDPTYQCKAFPLGIPEDIVNGTDPHSTPEAGQEGDYTYSPGGVYPSWAKDLGPIEKGGPTSGNWGHMGRPGFRGGSAAGGGFAFFPVMDRAKMGGHSEKDILGMVTLRRREMGTKHPGATIGQIAPGWENASLRLKLQTAKEDASFKAQRSKWAREDARKAKREKERAGEDTGENARKRLLEVEEKHQPGIDTMKVEYDAAYDVSRDERRKWRDMTQRASRREEDPDRPGRVYIRYYDAPAEGVTQEAWEAQRAKADKASARSTELVKPLIAAREEYGRDQRAAIMVKNPMTIDEKYRARWKKGDARDTARKAGWDNGREGFEVLVSEDLQADPMYVEFRKGGRGRSFQAGKEIHISVTGGATDVVHELGHRLEDVNPLARRSTTAFLNYRTQGEKVKSLRSVERGRGYRRDEKTKVDDFMSSYMGKVYGFGGTEILSMGLEYMYKKPVEFAKGDPGMFDMIYNLSRGVEWKPPAGG